MIFDPVEKQEAPAHTHIKGWDYTGNTQRTITHWIRSFSSSSPLPRPCSRLLFTSQQGATCDVIIYIAGEPLLYLGRKTVGTAQSAQKGRKKKSIFFSVECAHRYTDLKNIDLRSVSSPPPCILCYFRAASSFTRLCADVDSPWEVFFFSSSCPPHHRYFWKSTTNRPSFQRNSICVKWR